MRASWLDEAREVPLLGVARALGLELRGRGRRVSLAPCPSPSCGADRRGSTDRRGPIGLRPDGGGWRCFRCDAGGDGLALASLVLAGGPFKGPERLAEVRAFYAAQGWCAPANGTNGTTVRRRRPPAPRPAPEPPRYPPEPEILRTWEEGSLADADRALWTWLRSRARPGAIDPERVALLDLVRALPRCAEGFAWARRGGRSWAERGFRAIFPCFDASGRLRTVRARNVRPGVTGSGKAAAPRGFEVAGCVYADPVGLALLSGGTLGDGTLAADWVAENRGSLVEADGTVRPVGLYIAEGPTCFLAACCAWGEGSDSAPAVLGIDAGSWTPAFAARVPSGTAVFVATDLNPAGDNYARKINRDLGGRCEVRRIARWWRAGMPDKTPDVADLGVGGFVSVPMEPPPALEPRGRPAQPPGPSWAEVTRGVPRLVADALRDARPERALLVEVPTSAGKTEAALRAFAELPDLPPVRVYLAQSHKLLSEEADRLARLGFPEERMRRYEGLAHACRLGLRSPRRAWHCPKCPEKPACLAWSFTIPDDGEPVVVLMPHAAASQIEERWTRTAEEGGLGLDLGDLVAVWDELPAVVEVQTIRPEDLEPKECAGAGVGRTLALALAALRAAGERCAQEVEPGDWGESAELERFLRAEADLAALDRCAGAPLEELLTRTGSMGGRSTLAEYLRSGGSLPIRLDTVEALRLVLAEHTLLVSLPGPTWQAEIRRPVQVPPCATVYLSATAEYEEAELRGALRRRNVDLEIRGV